MLSYGTKYVKQIIPPAIHLEENDQEKEDMTLYQRKYEEEDKIRYVGTGYNLNGRFYRHGTGKLYFQDGSLEYEGAFFHDSVSGRGTCYWKNGRIMYEGEWKDGRWFGQGRNYWEDGTLRIEGSFAAGLLHGRGRFYKQSGKLYAEGTFKNAKANGEVRQYDEESGLLYYEGNYVDDCAHGHGRLYQSNGKLEYEGEVKYSELTGYGRSYSEDGKLLHEGRFLKGNPVGTPTEKDDEKPFGLGQPLFPSGTDSENPYSLLRDSSEDKRSGSISTLSDLLARSSEVRENRDADRR